MMHFVGYEFISYEDSLKLGRNQRNRLSSRTHVKEILKGYPESAEVLPPVTVNVVTGNIVDGQHRCASYQMAIETGIMPESFKLKVMLVEIPAEDETQAIIDANTHSKNWTIDDYIASYIKDLNPYYMQLDTWCKTHPLCVNKNKSKFRYGAAILTGKNCSKALKDGTFSFDIASLGEAEVIYKEMVSILELLKIDNKGAWTEGFAIAWREFRKFHPFKEWKAELKKSKYARISTTNQKEWANLFAQVHSAIDINK